MVYIYYQPRSYAALSVRRAIAKKHDCKSFGAGVLVFTET